MLGIFPDRLVGTGIAAYVAICPSGISASIAGVGLRIGTSEKLPDIFPGSNAKASISSWLDAGGAQELTVGLHLLYDFGIQLVIVGSHSRLTVSPSC